MEPMAHEQQRGEATREARRDSPILAMEDVCYSYGDLPVLDRVSLDVYRGEVVSIVGPSGCGKSTLLRLIAGIARASSGTIKVGREVVDERAGVTMVFQTDTLLPWMTVEANAELYARFEPRATRRAGAAERAERVGTLLKMVGLGDRTRAYPYQLSGGMRRRLAFVAAVAPAPPLLLLDEPFASVDEPTRIQIHQDVLRIIRQLNTTVILVTHDLAEAASLSDRVVIMTQRPASIAKEHAMPFGQMREIVALREQSDFLAVYGDLWRDLRHQLDDATTMRGGR
jgi:ABC-type nitrate/sulfonate/bicarbonate transport system ATPase subunit